ncbi:putative permease [Synechococcus sp. PCC 7502]|uniref:AI-2E family transporter n=1 Tax=Synechococcus sp. PCC 7502 TaxID=1173263 RepID=UPI00029FA99F|nr:AI-2E family transporter [Synechococcus sp. PCC 7502]AFY72942.1 putative permease [Synechococcus sp. PCC 7502]
MITEIEPINPLNPQVTTIASNNENPEPNQPTNLKNKLINRLLIGITFPLIIINGWLGLEFFRFFQPIFSILIAASILAFLLNYAVGLVTSTLGMKRGSAVLLVFLLAVSVLAAVAVVLVPIALTQLNELVKGLPSLIESGNQQLNSLQLWYQEQNIDVNIRGIAIQLTDRLSGQLQSLTGKVLGFALDTAGSVVNLLLILVMTYYLLSYGDRIWAGIFSWFPNSWGGQVQKSLRQNFKNYYIGQATLASLSGSSVTLAFLAMNVPFSILFGLAIGIMGLIPFGGALTVSIISFVLALQNFWLGVKVLATVIIIDQIIANVIAPRILGDLTGLNPVWILISLFVGLQIGGSLGLVIAVPLASAIKSTVDSLRSLPSN